MLGRSCKKKYIKSIISQKLRIAQKMSFMIKVSVRSIPNYAANLATYEENWIFERPKRPIWTHAHSAQTRYEISRPYLFSAYCASFISKWPLLKRGEGGSRHILSWETAMYVYIYMFMSYNMFITFRYTFLNIPNLGKEDMNFVKDTNRSVCFFNNSRDNGLI